MYIANTIAAIATGGGAERERREGGIATRAEAPRATGDAREGARRLGAGASAEIGDAREVIVAAREGCGAKEALSNPGDRAGEPTNSAASSAQCSRPYSAHAGGQQGSKPAAASVLRADAFLIASLCAVRRLALPSRRGSAPAPSPSRPLGWVWCPLAPGFGSGFGWLAWVGWRRGWLVVWLVGL